MLNMSWLMLSWIYLLHFGTANTICSFSLLISNSPILNCKEMPTADDIFQARKHLEKRNISGIMYLSMSYCRISKLSPGLFDFHAIVKIQGLNLSNNRLTSLPENLFNSKALTDLKELYLEVNELSYLVPKQFVHLQKLKILDLRNNKLNTLEPGLFTFNPINDLNLEENKIDKLPDEFFSGKISFTLETLTLRSNKLREIPNACLPQLRILELDDNNIGELSTALFNSTNLLTEIGLASNQINTLPKYFFYNQALSRLQTFYFSHNNLTFLFDEVFYSPYLQNLSFIDFSHNNIAWLSDKLFLSHYLQNLSRIILAITTFHICQVNYFTAITCKTLGISISVLTILPVFQIIFFTVLMHKQLVLLISVITTL